MKTTGPQSFWRAGQKSKTSRNAPKPPSRPQARKDAQHLGVWGDNPSGSPEGRALWRSLRRRGCRAEPCRCPRRTPPRRGAGVQRAEPFGAPRAGASRQQCTRKLRHQARDSGQFVKCCRTRSTEDESAAVVGCIK